jgi:fumarylacetoacetase
MNQNPSRLKSWVKYAPDTDFPIQNLPYGVFDDGNGGPRACVAIGDFVLDLALLCERNLFDGTGLEGNPFRERRLNAFMEQGRQVWRAVRNRITELLSEDHSQIRDDHALRDRALAPIEQVWLRKPVFIPSFVDFYSSEQHATNVGKMFRPDNPLMPNWKHLPVGYNGRASSIVPSGISVQRPMGQTMPEGAETPIFGPSKRLDYELEMGFFTGKRNPMGARIATSEVEDFLFGMVIVNDWSARDIQKWEYQPLGPFLAKSFATSISPWIVTFDALEPFRTAGPTQHPPVLPYLQCDKPWAFDIKLEVSIRTSKMDAYQKVCTGNFKTMYWNVAQQLAHQAVNGTNVQVGDLYASGTISGDSADSLGCLLELTQGGRSPIQLTSGETRTFLEDGDSVLMRAWCEGDGFRIGFGELEGTIEPAQ